MAYELKTRPTDASVAAYIDSLPSARRRQEARALVPLFEEVTGQPARLWGPSIIGFGQYAYRYASGHSGQAARVGFSPRKAALTLYLMPYDEGFAPILKRLGKHRASVACVYVSKLEDVDLAVLREAVRYTWDRMGELYPQGV